MNCVLDEGNRIDISDLRRIHRAFLVDAPVAKSSPATMSAPNTAVMYAGKITQRPLGHVSDGRQCWDKENILHDSVEEEQSEPVVMTDGVEVREVLVEISAVSARHPQNL